MTLKQVEQLLSKSTDARVEIDDDTHFRNTYGADEPQEAGKDIKFVYRDHELRRFPGNEAGDASQFYGFTWTDFITHPSTAGTVILTFGRLIEVLESK